ncbi:YIP1 family protein [Candidatus Woesearchaeota archaeon]|nr:YIP1 family protein [Candidatus Woesearchaeota archaeon]
MTATGYFKRFIERIKSICFRTREFFEGVHLEHSLWTVILFILLLQVIVLPLYIVVIRQIVLAPILLLIARGVIALISGLLLLFVIVPLYHLSVLIFGGRNGIKRTFQAFLYGATPTILLSWIPFIGIFALPYSMYITIIGLITLHEMKTYKALLAYFIPVLIAVAFIIMATAITSVFLT